MCRNFYEAIRFIVPIHLVRMMLEEAWTKDQKCVCLHDWQKRPKLTSRFNVPLFLRCRLTQKHNGLLYPSPILPKKLKIWWPLTVENCEEFHTLINEIHSLINEFHTVINEIHTFFNDNHTFINEIHTFINKIELWKNYFSPNFAKKKNLMTTKCGKL